MLLIYLLWLHFIYILHFIYRLFCIHCIFAGGWPKIFQLTNKPFTKLRFTKFYLFILELIVGTRGIFEI